MIAALLIPHVLAGPVVGLLTDRADRPTRVLAAAGAGFAAALAVTTWSAGHAGPVLVLAVLVAGGCCGPALTGALSSQLPTVVPPRGLARAFGLDSLTYDVAGITGPLLATLVATATGTAGAATASLAGSAVLGALMLLTFPPPGRPNRPDGHHLPTDDRRATRDRPPTNPPTGHRRQQPRSTRPGRPARRRCRPGPAHRHPAAAGWLLSAVAAGGLLGSLAWTWRPGPPEHAARRVLAGLAGVGAPLPSPPSSPAAWPSSSPCSPRPAPRSARSPAPCLSPATATRPTGSTPRSSPSAPD